MRMRRKKNLDKRLADCGEIIFSIESEDKNFNTTIEEKEYIDLIVSDIMMPRMDGYTLVRSLRDAGNTIPVLMITAKDSFQDMQFGFLAGTDDYMVKPVNVNELVLRIHALLRRGRDHSAAGAPHAAGRQRPRAHRLREHLRHL